MQPFFNQNHSQVGKKQKKQTSEARFFLKTITFRKMKTIDYHLKSLKTSLIPLQEAIGM